MSDVFYHFNSVISRVAPPEIDSVIAHFFGATRLVPADRASLTGAQRIVKNIYNLPAAFSLDTHLVVTRAIAEELRRVAQLETRPVVISVAYSYPYAAGDLSYLEDPCFIDAKTTEEAIANFPKEYRCEPPDIELCQLLTKDVWHEPLPGDSRDDYHSYDVCDASAGLVSKFVVSRSILEEYGLCRCFGYQCTEDVFKVIRKYLASPYWAWMKLKY